MAPSNVDAQYLLKYIRGCKYSLEKTKQKLDLTLTVSKMIKNVTCHFLIIFHSFLPPKQVKKRVARVLLWLVSNYF